MTTSPETPAPSTAGFADAARRLTPTAPPEWTGSDEAFVRCLSNFASTVLEAIAGRCDALQRFEPDGAMNGGYNDGVVAATRLVMALASQLHETKRAPSEWTATRPGDLTPEPPARD